MEKNQQFNKVIITNMHPNNYENDCCEVETRVTEISSQFNILNDNTSQLESLVAKLWSKLRPVTRPELVAERPIKTASQDIVTELGKGMYTQNVKLEQVIDSIGNILDLTEL